MKLNSKHQTTRRGFSLIELLTVITILAVLGGLGFGTYMQVNRSSKAKQAKAMIDNLSAQLEIRVNQGYSAEELEALGGLIDASSGYPDGNGGKSSSEGVYALLSGDFDLNGRVDDDRVPVFPQIDPEYEGKGKYVNEKKLVLIDPWLNPLRYEYPGLNNNVENGFDIWSAGPDGEYDNEDDVKNW